MSTPQTPNTKTGKKSTAAADLNPFAKTAAKAPAAPDATETLPRLLPLTRKNFILMGVAGLLIVLGFILMTGAPSGADSFNPDIFSTRRIVVGPTISFLGYIAMGVAIMWPTHRRRAEASAESSETKTSAES